MNIKKLFLSTLMLSAFTGQYAQATPASECAQAWG